MRVRLLSVANNFCGKRDIEAGFFCQMRRVQRARCLGNHQRMVNAVATDAIAPLEATQI